MSGESIIFEDRGEIDMDSVAIDVQPCRAMNYQMGYDCTLPGIYRIFGQYRDKHKGARFKAFNAHLCAEHLSSWAKLHGTTVEALLKGSGV